MSLVNDQIEQRQVHILGEDKTSNNNFSTKGSDKKSKQADHDALSNMEKQRDLSSYRSKGLKANLRFNS